MPLSKAIIRTPWNPTGAKKRPNLARPTYLSGARLKEITLSTEEITLLNQLKPGKYHGKKWVVVERDGDKDGSAIDVLVPNRTPEQKLEHQAAVKDLADMLRQIVAEQERGSLAAAA